MKKRSLLLMSMLGIAMGLGSCGSPAPSPSGSGGGGQSSSKGSEVTSGMTSSKSGDASDESEKEDVVYTGKVRIWYHRDDMNYRGLAIYLWNTSVDGQEYEWTGEDDEYGVYFDIDLSTSEQFKDAPSTDIRLIIKQAGSWAGQSLDTFCYFKNYEITDGVMNIYTAAGEGKKIDTFGLREDALGDHFDTAYVDSSWQKIIFTGVGTKGDRKEEEVGLIKSYKLYGFTPEYYGLKPSKKAERQEEFLIKEENLSSPAKSVTVNLGKDIDPSIQYEVRGTFVQNPDKLKAKAVGVRGLFDTAKFQQYTYSGDDLGVTVNADGTKTFKVWAPTSSQVKTRFYIMGTPWNLRGRTTADLYADRLMERDVNAAGKWNGVWKYTMPADDYYTWYTYVVTNSGGVSETIDPYAKSAGLNGERGYTMDWEKGEGDPEGWNRGQYVDSKLPKIKSANNLTVYEAHIRDLTADSTWVSNKGNIRGGFNAFAEEGTTYTKGQTTVKTGFDHIKEMGVNAIQLLPVFDQDNDERQATVYKDFKNGILNEESYNWGYNPQNYNVVEGAYSSDPEDPLSRTKEFKSLIMKAADNGIRVIMDVVYNHMSSVANNAFTKLVPEYFFRTDANGNYTDGSGCGNEIASERTMVSKFIVDSVSWWAKEYRVKGFRFDLMGCIDVDTMKAVRTAVNKIDPTIVLYGEGWTGGGTALDGSKQSSTGNIYAKLNTDPYFPVGGFNDHGRDGAKGNTSYGDVTPAGGWISETSNMDNVYNMLTQILGENRNVGSTPNQTVNYLACHDNYTLYDQINYLFYKNAGSFGDGNHEAVMKAATSLTALSIFGQGIGFINGGDEIFRQKLITKDNPLFDTLVETYKHGSYTHPDGRVDNWIEGDGIKITNDMWLVRNSYKYGDAVNSYKWDRKADPTVNANYQQWVNIVKLRNQEMGNTLGQDETTVKKGENGGTWCWSHNDLFDEGGRSKTDIVAGGFIGKNDGKQTFILTNKGNNDSATIGIGNQKVKVLYSSTGDHTVGEEFTISNNLMGLKKFETIILRNAD